MPKENVALVAMNRGRVSRLSLARTDIKRIAFSAEQQTNWMPRVLGSAMLRPGLKYLASSNGDKTAVGIPFIFSTTDIAIIELTDYEARFMVSDAFISHAAVTSTISNGTFGSDITGWTDGDEAGATSAWLTGGYMSLIGSGYAAAIRTQEITVSGGNVNAVHVLRIVIQRGPVTLRVGSTSGTDNYISETALGTGTHSLALTPSGNFFIQFSSRSSREVLVDSVALEGADDTRLPTPWPAAALPKIRYAQSGDVVFVACEGYQQRRIERRGSLSWSIVLYEPEDGPFRNENTGPIRLTPSALSGAVTITASAAFFKSTNVGGLIRIQSAGQRVQASISGEDQWTSPVKVTGVGSARNLTYGLTDTGSYSATTTVQRSIGQIGAWTAVLSFGTGESTYNDGLDNQIVYYRIGVATGAYTSGTGTAYLEYASGSIKGVARITAYSSETSVSGVALTDFGGTSASEVWSEGAWSDRRGWPTAVAFYEGRLCWAGKDKVWLSVSDAFASFDSATEGDSGPISRTVGAGPVDVVNWLLPMQRLLIGAQGAEVSARSTSFDEPLTPTNFNIKEASTQGSAGIAATRIDSRGLFVQRGGTRVFELAVPDSVSDYQATDLTALVPEIGEPALVQLAVQRQPDTRVHAIRSDGTAAVLVFDPAENVICWVDVETDGNIEAAVVLPGAVEDAVYYLVKRTINGSTKRYWEKWALESECRGGTLSRCADSFKEISQSSSTTITGLSHLEGEEVVIWANGKDLGTKTVASGQITGLSEAVTTAIVGLTYRARFKSTKLAFASGMGTALNQRKRVNSLGLILADTHAQGLRYGPDFVTMDELPLIEQGAAVDEDSVWEAYDEDMIEFPGEWSTDSRICLEANAPRPCTILAATISMATHDKG